jgi:hypothetical protein
MSTVGADVEFGPLKKLAVEGPAADAHELGGLGAIAAGLDEGLAEQALLVGLAIEAGGSR